MTFHMSTGARNGILLTSPLKTLLAAGFVQIYSGIAPANADNAIGSAGTNVLLCTISNNSTGTGINLDVTATGGIILKLGSEVWSGTNAATGTASFYRHVAVGDTGVLSTTQVRLQGDIATSGVEMNLSSTSLTSAATQTIDYYSIALPTL